MKKRTLKMVSLCLSVLLLLAIIPAFAFAESSNHIYANEITAEPGSTISIPVYISKNSGFMGVSLTFSYADVFTAKSVDKGSLIKTGLFDDSIGTGSSNDFKVVWCGTRNITEDGEICILNFDVDDSASGEYTIKVSYESQNTFDSNYKDVKLSCDNIKVKISSNEPAPQPTFWQKVVNFFTSIWNWIKGLFVK